MARNSNQFCKCHVYNTWRCKNILGQSVAFSYSWKPLVWDNQLDQTCATKVHGTVAWSLLQVKWPKIIMETFIMNKRINLQNPMYRRNFGLWHHHLVHTVSCSEMHILDLKSWYFIMVEVIRRPWKDYLQQVSRKFVLDVFLISIESSESD